MALRKMQADMSNCFNYDFEYLHFPELDSTNNYAKRLIEEHRQSGDRQSGNRQSADGASGDRQFADGHAGAGQPGDGCVDRCAEDILPLSLVISADRQTSGRGRCGKSFVSPSGSSIYMTVVLKIGKAPDKCQTLTPAAAVGTLKALEEAGSGELGIKWVNDLFLKDRKVCGILTEAVFAEDASKIEYVIVGIGINIDLDLDTLPEEVREVAGTLKDLRLAKSDMVQSIAEHVRTELMHAIGGKTGFMRIYRERSILIGRGIYWNDAAGRHTGLVRDINDIGNLIVDEDGRTDGTVTLMSGEVSVRRLDA